MDKCIRILDSLEFYCLDTVLGRILERMDPQDTHLLLNNSVPQSVD